MHVLCIVNNTSLGVVLIDDEINALTDYSYINTRFRDSDSNIGIACCMTGLGPNGIDNGLLEVDCTSMAIEYLIEKNVVQP